MMPPLDQLNALSDSFVRRHIGPDEAARAKMLAAIGVDSLDHLVAAVLPAALQTPPLDLPPALDEAGVLAELQALASQNRADIKSLIGQGYHGTILPAVIRRNVLENPGWYTAYTPYQAEIAQGRLEALLNFQTMVCDLTGMAIANASLLDEGTAAAEAVSLALAAGRNGRNRIALAADLHPQTKAVLATRAAPLGIDIIAVEPGDIAAIQAADAAALVLQYPGTSGAVRDLSAEIAAVQQGGGLAIVAADLLGLALLTPPGEMGADIVIGSSQRFGVPMGFGGPHAAFFATRDKFRRLMPGRLVGRSIDAAGAPALRLALQTREQHIRREKATSNICTAQVLLAVIAGFYAVWHGPDGLRRIAARVNLQARLLADAAHRAGWTLRHSQYFDTICLDAGSHADGLIQRALDAGFNLRRRDDGGVAIALDETVTLDALTSLATVLGAPLADAPPSIPPPLERTSAFLQHAVFHAYRGEHDMLRFIKRLEERDISLTRSMIPLGSCTMKLNAAAEMLPISWPGFANIHPFAPSAQTAGYQTLLTRLADMLSRITGLPGVSLQPNAGSQGEYAGLLTIRAFHAARGESHRDICLVPASAHGTNPASAVMAGYRVVVVGCDKSGNVDVDDLAVKTARHAHELAALMITWPSTHGVFEPRIADITSIIHAAGGQVYLDGANMNAQVGVTSPAAIGADVCHLNLHKTFCIPHGGGGPGIGPIAVAAHLVPHLPTAVSAAPFGSAGILPISYAYIRMMGGPGLRQATLSAILSANFIAARLRPFYLVLFAGAAGLVAHECIIDCRGFQASAGITVEDIAKRLQDYGFHAPTMSWPVAGTLMIEPTESESLDEIDRFCEAMIAVRQEIAAIEAGAMDRADNPLKNAPHTMADLTAEPWPHSYSRRTAVFPLPWVEARKYWPPVKRVDNVFGDRNLVCTCAPVADYAEAAE
jgi:glycine dehydrogenase